MVYCRQCGYNNDKYSRMCKRCGCNLREADNLYDKDEQLEQEPGGMRFARKQESLAKRMLAPFKKLGRVEKGKKRFVALITAIIVLVVCGGAVLGVTLYNRYNSIVPDEYGNATGNIAHNAIAVSDGEMTFYTKPYGDNTGLYRIYEETGEELKLSYQLLTSLSCSGNWVYGLNSTGQVLRVSKDGLVTQTVVEANNASFVNVVGNVVYYLDSSGRICRAQQPAGFDEEWFVSEYIGQDVASGLFAYNGWLYYTTADGFVKPSGSVEITNYEHVQQSEEQPLRASGELSLLPPNLTDNGYGAGCIKRMRYDGSEAETLYDGTAYNLTVRGEYLYFCVETRNTVSASDIDANAPDRASADIIGVQTLRQELVPNATPTKLLEPETAQSPLNVSGGTIYSITAGGNLLVCSTAGSGLSELGTGTLKIYTVCVAGDWLYFTGLDTSDSSDVVGRVRSDGSGLTVLCSRAPEQPTEE